MHSKFIFSHVHESPSHVIPVITLRVQYGLQIQNNTIQPQTGEHLVEGCRLLMEARRDVDREELGTWKSRHVHRKEKERKGTVEPEKVKEEDKLETFFCKIHEFHNPVPVAPVFIPAELPSRYAIDFVPAAPSVTPPAVSTIPVPVSGSSTGNYVSSTSYSVISFANFVVSYSAIPATNYSVISSVNFVVPDSISSSSSTCIETT